MKFLFKLFLSVAFLATASLQASEVKTLSSPSGNVRMAVSVGEKLTWSLTYDGKTVLSPSNLGLTFKNAPALGEMKVADCTVKTINETWSNPLSKKSVYVNHCAEMELKTVETNAPYRELILVFRAYDDGVALRYVVPEQSALPGAFVLTSDDTQFSFTGDWTCWASDQKQFNTSQEKEFPAMKLSDVSEDSFMICPLVVSGDFGYCALLESDLLKWAGAQFAAAPGNKAGEPCALAVRLTPRKDGNGCVMRETGAKSPWRVVTLGKTPADLVNNSGIVLNCATPCVLEDASWVEAGASSWDWWSEGNLVLNTETLKSRIDLAAENGWKFTTLDDPWYFNSKFQFKPEYLTDTASGCGTIDLPEAFAYAKSKGVKIFLWMHYQDFDFCGHERTFTAYEKWGAAGMKIDFMDSDNQERVEWIEDVVKNAAKHHLMINFHGMYKPTGMERTYPNQITREGILGNEYNKFSGKITSEHCATLPFTRWLCGPGDFTPGGFVNRQPEHFYTQKNLRTPTCCEQGTRAHALAMCLITDSPCLTICDSPQNYAGQPGFSFLKGIPAVWDETVALDGEIGKYYLHYRRSGDKFYVGAITNAEARELSLKLDFLKPGKTYVAQIFCDTPQSTGTEEKDAEKIAEITKEVTSTDALTIQMVRNGGWTAIFTEK